jgi:hypothetical protein
MFLSALAEDVFIPMQNADIQVDGKLIEKEWLNAATVENFYELNSNQTFAKQSTQVKFWCNGKSIYIGFICHEKNMNQLKTHQTKRDDSVWNDDCVEIFLSPHVNADPYYQFVVNAIGTQCDIKVSNHGMTKDPSWNGRWQAKSTQNAEGYAVEIQLPFQMFGRPDSETWRIAFARENKASGSNSSWPPMRGGFHEPVRYANLNGVKVDKSCFNLMFDQGQFQYLNNRNSVISGKLQLEIRSEIDIPYAELSLDISNDEGFNIKKTAFKTVLKKGRNQLEIPVSFLSGGNYKGQAIVTNEKNNDQADFIWKFEVKSNPFVAEMVFPSYRNLIMDSMNLRELKLVVNAQTNSIIGENCLLELRNTQNQVVGSPMTIKLNSGNTPVSYPLPAIMPYGNYLLTIAINENKQVIELQKVKPAVGVPEIYFDEDNNMVVEGQKMIPLGFYYSPPAINNFKASGYNLIVSQNENHLNDFDKNRIYSFGCSRQYIESVCAGTPPNQLKPILDKTQKQFQGNYPSVVGWYVADEPELTVKDTAAYRTAVRKLLELSPQCPLLVCHNTSYGLSLDADLVDIISVDPYLGFERDSKVPLKPYDRIAVEVDAARKSVKNGKPVWAVLECYAAGYYGGNLSRSRYPTIQEIRSMTYLAIIHGAKGVIYWDSSVLNARQLWPAMKLFGHEFQYLAPFIMVPDLSGAQMSGEIHYLCKKLNDKICIIAMNPRGETVRAAIPVESSGLYHVLSENRTMSAAAGQIVDSFEPYSTHIYCSFPTPENQFTEVLKNYRLEDSFIGISSSDNLCNYWYGAVPSASSTNPYRQICGGCDGAFVSDWIWGGDSDKNPKYEVKLYRKGHIRKIIYSADKLPKKLEVYDGRKWMVPDYKVSREYYLYWDDDADLWKESLKKPDIYPGYQCYELQLDCLDVESIRVWGAKYIQEIQCFE